LFVGLTGVGKTALAINYSNYLFGENKVIRIDGSEYKDITSINKILGSSPGYVGYDDNKNKLEEIRNNPHSLILFDEIEKAHPSILNLFLQILDEGKITDNNGHVVNFKNNIIIMTSNIGFNKNDVGFTEYTTKNDSKLKEFIPLELLNRLKKVIYFNKMEYYDIYSIIKRKIGCVKEKFANKNIKIHISNSVIDKLVKLTRYEEFGARKIDQVIEDEIDNYVIDNILEGNKEIIINS
jgi:ATP-dependent Clp protease ATP-binding subunit ClpA